MTSLRNIKTLLGRCDAGLKRCDMRRIATEREMRENEQQAATLHQQKSGLRQMAQQARPSGVIDKSQLNLCQHRIAVYMQKIKELEVQESSLRQKRDGFEQQLSGLKAERQIWQRKQEKYLAWADKQKKIRRLTVLRQEETETEEIITWTP